MEVVMTRTRFVLMAMMLSVAAATPAQQLFFDDFEDGAGPEWGNEYGDWLAEDGVYTATIQSNDPPTYTSVTTLPELEDFSVELDILGAHDGGIFLRSRRCDNGAIDGVLLVVGGYHGTYNGCYWHIFTCDGVSDPLNQVDVPGLQGSDLHVRIVVSGGEYAAYLGDDAEPLTTLSTDSHASGRVALYEYLDQAFDNVLVLGSATGVDDGPPSPLLSMDAACPNPFNPRTTIRFELPAARQARLTIHDLRGRVVATLVDGFAPSGRHEVTWTGRDDGCRDLPSGVYLSRLEAGRRIVHGRMTLVR
jgi:hypothetical protein